MKASFYLKEEEELEEDYITITVVRKSKSRSQSLNSKKMDDLTAVEQQNIKHLIETVEKYGNDINSSVKLNYNL